MVKISYTNIIVDQFSTARSNPFNRYIHFLTHIHTDHLKGLSNSWDCGTIYCSPITKKLLLLKFPRLKCLKQLQLQKQHTIALSSQLDVVVTLFDSNHCAGGVMLLIQGYMGSVLYSGDMRFDRDVFSQYGYLYPHSKRNKNFTACSKEIDFLYLDITFLHPKFDFPKKCQALKQLDQFIENTIQTAKKQNKFIEFYIGMDNFGKQQVLVHLSQKFQTLITVSQERYKNISTIGLESNNFSTDPDAGFIHVVLKRQLKQYLAAKQNSIGIILTGWANKAHYRSKKTYAIPYSLHSSYPQLVAFVDSIRPSVIESILQQSSLGKFNKSQQSTNSSSLFQKNQISSLYGDINYHQYLNKFRNELTSKPSTQLTYLMSDVDFQKKIKDKLKLDRTTTQINRQQFGMSTTIVQVQNLNRAGARFSGETNEKDLQKIKQKLKNKQDLIKNRISNDFNSRRFSRKPISFGQKTQKQNESSPLQIEDQQPFQDNENRQYEQKRNMNYQNNRYQDYQIQKSKQIQIPAEQDNSQTTRRFKWKKKIDEGQIDLFGQVPIRNTINLNAKATLKKSPNSDDKGLKEMQQKRTKTIHKRRNQLNKNNPIQLSDSNQQFDEDQQENVSKSNKNNSQKNGSQQKNMDLNNSKSSSSNKSNKSTSNKQRQQGNQRSIVQYLSKKKSSDKSRQNIQNINQSNLIQLQNYNQNKNTELQQLQQIQREDNKNQPKQPQSAQYYLNRQQNQFRGKRVLRNCHDFNILNVDLTRIEEIKEAPVKNYHLFFLNKK